MRIVSFSSVVTSAPSLSFQIYLCGVPGLMLGIGMVGSRLHHVNGYWLLRRSDVDEVVTQCDAQSNLTSLELIGIRCDYQIFETLHIKNDFG